MKTDIFTVGGNETVEGTDTIFETRPHLLPKDVADAVVFVLSTAPGVLVGLVDIF